MSLNQKIERIDFAINEAKKRQHNKILKEQGIGGPDPTSSMRRLGGSAALFGANRASLAATTIPISQQKNHISNTHEQVIKEFEYENTTLKEMIRKKLGESEDLYDMQRLQSILDDIESHERENTYLLNIVPIIEKISNEAMDSDDRQRMIHDYKTIVDKYGPLQRLGTIPTDIAISLGIYNSDVIPKTATTNHIEKQVITKANIEKARNRNLDFCSCGGMVVRVNDEVSACNVCGKEVSLGLSSTMKNISYDQSKNMQMSVKITYDRKSHFKDVLAQYQAKEYQKIPKEVLDRIKMQLKRERVDVSKLNREQIKGVIKRCGFSEYLENATYIMTTLKGGVRDLDLDPLVEDVLCKMFDAIQEPFERHKTVLDDPKQRKAVHAGIKSKTAVADLGQNSTRTNFFSYVYVIRKLLEVIGLREEASIFPLPKSKDKLVYYDRMWKLICQDLGWPFNPTDDF